MPRMSYVLAQSASNAAIALDNLSLGKEIEADPITTIITWMDTKILVAGESADITATVLIYRVMLEWHPTPQPARISVEDMQRFLTRIRNTLTQIVATAQHMRKVTVKRMSLFCLLLSRHAANLQDV